ncbi:MAG: hypothetical protein IKV41_06435 [Oscillospiraceae bacterium]|nr:hypothetical protein [Oscillospiraceae bacterium]
MQKKLMYAFMAINTLLALISVIVLIRLERVILPIPVLLLSGLLNFSGLLLTVSGMVKKGSRAYQLSLYHIGVIFVSVVNLLIMKNFPMAINFWEAMIIGTLVHAVVSAFLLYITVLTYNRMMRKARFIVKSRASKQKTAVK